MQIGGTEKNLGTNTGLIRRHKGTKNVQGNLWFSWYVRWSGRKNQRGLLFSSGLVVHAPNMRLRPTGGGTLGNLTSTVLPTGAHVSRQSGDALYIPMQK